MILLFSWSGIVSGALWFLLVISTLLLIAVILLQEGKGGGLAEAFGGAGAETFGVKAHGINKFTAVVGTVFLVLCVLLVKIRSGPDTTPLLPDAVPSNDAPMIPGMNLPPRNANGAKPGSSGTQPPAGDSSDSNEPDSNPGGDGSAPPAPPPPEKKGGGN